MTTPDPNLKRTISKMMHGVRAGQLPGSETIVREAFQELDFDSAHISQTEARAGFNDILHVAFRHTLTVLERYENEAYSEGIARALLDLRPELVTRAEAIDAERGFEPAAQSLLAGLYLELRESFLSVSQSRKTRGGKDFELSFAQALSLAGFPYEMQHRQLRTDFILPSDEAFDYDRTVCVVASLKRTLRERWQEVAGELKNLSAPNVFLVTADDKVSAGHVRGICDTHRLYLVVWDSVKAAHYPHHPHVLGFTQFANQRLPQLQSQWENAGLTDVNLPPRVTPAPYTTAP